MVSMNYLFECPKCGYQEVRKIGDVRPDPKEFKKCPRCGSFMENRGTDIDYSKIFLNNLVTFFTSKFK